MNIKNMNEDEIVCVLEQIREICDSVNECCVEDCIFARIYKDHPNQVCPFNQTPFRWDFREEIKND